jgi:peptidoglycan hydrolase-like protein with peptidoglycan-binding domain
MVRTVTKKAKEAIVDAAQGVRTIAGEAFGAATKAAADVVFDSTANALEAGRARLRRATPAMENALGNAARRSVSKRKPGRRKTAAKTAAARKRGAKRKAVSRKKAPKARRATKRRRTR